MDGNPPSQKQTAQKYDGNLGYFRKSHYLRRLRGWCFVIAVLCSLIAVASYQYWGSGRIFSKGPISKNHASFAQDCRACHVDAETDALKALLAERPSGTSLQAILTAKPPRKDGESGRWPAQPSLMDAACLKCHTTYGLHTPQSAALTLRDLSNDISLVHATQCSVCHREHISHDAMAAPDRQTCASCHNNADALRQSRTALLHKGAPVAATGENRDLGDGLVRFLPPAKASAPLPPFADYAHGHPAFGYEQANLRDPAELKFNHARHRREDVSALGPNHTLACADCHTPGPGGIYYQSISYARNCQQCHSLQLQPSLPKLMIPHGDAEKVRYFLASIPVAIGNAIRAEEITAPAEFSSRLETEMQNLKRRSSGELADLEQRVFFEGDPKDTPGDRRMRAGNRKFLTECAKCHTVLPGDAGKAPHINPPNMAERWVQRGPFTHLPHRHMDCAECHPGAKTSELTSDILMPPQKLCAECHRPPSAGSLTGSAAASKLAGGELAAMQRRLGGIKWDCQSCHVFHAPPDADTLTQSLRSPK